MTEYNVIQAGPRGIGTARTVTNATEFPAIAPDRASAYANLPAGQILPVRFTKQ